VRISVKNWHDFQHYNKRCPPWIKLHRAILDDFEFHCLPVASRALAPCLWLIGSEHKDGEIDASSEKLAFRLRQTPKQIDDALRPLIDKGFFIVVQDAINPPADRKQDTHLETEGETETYKQETENTFAANAARSPLKQIEFDLEKGVFKGISEDQELRWQSAYPAVPIPPAIEQAAAWLKANPANRKKNNERFLVNWFSRAQDRAGRVQR